MAVGIEADLGALVGRAARGLEKAADAEAAQLAPCRRRGAACRKVRNLRLRRGIVEVGGKTAAIDCHAQRAAMREFGDQVAPAQAHRVGAEPQGRDVDQPLDHIIGLGLAGAAVGVDRHRVGKGAAHIHEDCRNGVDAAHAGRRRIGRAAGAVRG